MAVSEDVEQAEYAVQNELHELRRRKSRDTRATPLTSTPFAGRIGGNQEFTLSSSDSDFASVISKQPDAAARFTWAQSFSLTGFTDIELWKHATVEGVGTCLQIYLSCMYSVGLAPLVTATSLGPVTPAIFGSLTSALMISLFIYAAGPVSGGHMNPLITMSTFTAKLSTFPRTLLYVVFQCTGSVIASFLARASLGAPPAVFRTVPGCYIDATVVTPGQAYAFETMSSFALLFLAFGLGLDPRQGEVFGAALSPALVGLALALCSFVTGIARAGYSGASFNPARCLGLMAAAENFEYHYIHWFGDMTAAILIGIMYNVIPIHKI